MRHSAAALLVSCFLMVMSFRAEEPPQGKDFSNKEQPRADFESANLPNANFSKSKYPFSNFKRAVLTGASFRDADLSSGSFDSAKLSGADFRGAMLLNSSFENADLSNANLSGLNLKGVSLAGANLKGADLRGTKNLANLSRADLAGALLQGADFSITRDYTGKSIKFAGAKYDMRTKFPRGYNPEVAQAVLVAEDESPIPKTPATTDYSKAQDVKSGTGPRDWTVYQFKSLGFSVSFPQEPKQLKIPQQGPDGAAAPDLNTLVVTVSKSESYLVTVTPSRSADVEAALDAVVKRQGNNLVFQRKLLLNGKYQGREIVSKTSFGLNVQRVYVADEKLYQVMVNASRQQADSNNTRLFLESFTPTEP